MALEIGINPNMLSRWGREVEDAQAFAGTGTPRDEELARLKKEQDFLRDAAVYFAKGSSNDTK